MTGHDIVLCPKCGSAKTQRVRRDRTWMRMIPGSALYRCRSCGSHQLSALGTFLDVGHPSLAGSEPSSRRSSQAAGTEAKTAPPRSEPPAQEAAGVGTPAGDGLCGRAQMEAFYGFTSSPFAITPDPAFVFPSREHQRVLSELLSAIHGRQGYAVVTGDVGCGKTTLCRLLMGELGDSVSTALVLDPDLTDVQLLAMLAEDFGVSTASRTLKGYLGGLSDFLLERANRGMATVLIVDEAQNMPAETLGSIRMLSNFETSEAHLLQTLLVGRPELRDHLCAPELAQLRRCINTWCQLPPLGREEMREYIRHRIRAAGGDGTAAFLPDAMDAVFDSTLGIPRRVNALCDRALKAACLRKAKQITFDMVREAAISTGQP